MSFVAYSTRIVNQIHAYSQPTTGNPIPQSARKSPRSGTQSSPCTAAVTAQAKEAATESTSSQGNSTWELSDSRADKSNGDRFSHGSQRLASAEPMTVAPSKTVGRSHARRRDGSAAS